MVKHKPSVIYTFLTPSTLINASMRIRSTNYSRNRILHYENSFEDNIITFFNFKWALLDRQQRSVLLVLSPGASYLLLFPHLFAFFPNLPQPFLVLSALWSDKRRFAIIIVCFTPTYGLRGYYPISITLVSCFIILVGAMKYGTLEILSCKQSFLWLPFQMIEDIMRNKLVVPK